MDFVAFRGFSSISTPCLFVNPIDGRTIYPYAKNIIIEDQNKKQEFLRGHKHWITAIDMSPKGRMIASGENSRESDIIVWNYKTKQQLYNLSEHDNGITALNFSNDERLLATTANDNRLIIWDMATGNMVLHKKVQPTTCVKWGGQVPDVKGRPTLTFYLATSGPQGVQLHIVDPSGRIDTTNLPQGKYTRDIKAMAFTKTYLLCGTSSSDVLVFDLHSLTMIKVNHLGKGGVTSIYTAPDGGIIASCRDGCIFAIHEEGSQLLQGIKRPIASLYDNRLITEDGSLLSSDGQTIWDSHPRPVTSISVCGTTAVSCCTDETIKVWDATNLDCKLSFKTNYHSPPVSVGLSPALLVIGHENGAAGGYDFTTGEHLFKIEHAHHTAVNVIEISPTRRFFATGGDDTTVRIWDVRSRAMMTKFAKHDSSISSIAIVPSATHIFSASIDKSVCLFDIQSEELLERFTCFESGVRDIAIHDDILLAATQDGHIYNLHPSEGTKPFASIKTHEANTIAISPDGMKFAIGHISGDVSVWDTQSMKMIGSMPCHSASCADIRFVDAGKVMSAGSDGGIALINA